MHHRDYYHYYCDALVEKAMTCKTSESKDWIIGLMNEALTRIPKSSNYGIKLSNRCSTFKVRFSIKLMTEEVVDMRGVNPNYPFAIVFFGLNFNRYEVAEFVLNRSYYHSFRIKLEEAIEFIGNKIIAHIEDLPRAVEILKKFLGTETDKESFDNFVKENHII